ncbi:MAG: type II secretion system minor pseudopilin GspK [Steroidobacteraceae bacterium]
MKRRRERGVILISVMVLVALAAVVATGMFFDTAMMARRSAGTFSMEQALLLGQGAESLAAFGLTQDKNSTDSPDEPWAQPYGPVEVAPEVSLEALVLDQQGRFNLNSLVNDKGRDENAYKVFTRLLQLLQLDTRLADKLVDWIDADVIPQPEGGEDGLYLSQDPPHRTGNVAVTSISELQQLPDFTREMYLTLAPHVTALPPSVRTINICAADGVVLDALLALGADTGRTEYSVLQPAELATRRARGCFPRQGVFAPDGGALKDYTTESSSWFRLQTWVRIGTAEFALYSLLYRTNGKVQPVLRSMGTE